MTARSQDTRKTGKLTIDHKIAPKRKTPPSPRLAKESLLVSDASRSENTSSEATTSLSSHAAALDTQPQSAPDETLGPYDIICGRNKLAFNNIGNRRFRVTIQLLMDRYMAATTRNETSKVIVHVADLVRENGGRFLRLSSDGKSWIELDKKQAHEKVGHALRDAASTKREADSTTTSNSFPFSRPSCCKPMLELQKDSANISNTLPNEYATYQRTRDTSISPSRSILSEPALHEWMATLAPEDAHTNESRQPQLPIPVVAVLTKQESPDDDTKPSAVPKQKESRNIQFKPTSSSLSPPRPARIATEPNTGGRHPATAATSTCSNDRDNETFDHSSFSEFLEASLEWNSDDTIGN